MRHQVILIFSFLCLYSCSSDPIGNREAGLYEKGITLVGGKVQVISDYSEKDATIFYLVRHAEKETGEDPGLTGEGALRAKNLAAILKEVPLNGIYSTNLKRTVNTVIPTAGLKKIEVNNYNARQQKELVENLISRKGEQFLIVGHSNTIPGLLNLFQKKKVYKDINESEFDNLYIVKVNSEKVAQILELKF